MNTAALVLQIAGFGLMYYGGANWWELGGLFVFISGYGIQRSLTRR